MDGYRPGQNGPQSSSSSTPNQYGRVTTEEFDDDDQADLSLDDALLSDDPLGETSGKVPYAIPAHLLVA